MCVNNNASQTALSSLYFHNTLYSEESDAAIVPLLITCLWFDKFVDHDKENLDRMRRKYYRNTAGGNKGWWGEWGWGWRRTHEGACWRLEGGEGGMKGKGEIFISYLVRAGFLLYQFNP